MLPRDLDLNLLRALEALLVTESVTGAARRIGVGQPAVSKQLEKLRAVLGDPLLVRQGRRLVLTARARALVPVVGDAVAALGRTLAPAEAFDPGSARGVLHLALNDEAAALLLAPTMEELARTAPGLDVRVRALGRDLPAELDAGQTDLAVIPDLRGVRGFDLPDLERFVMKRLGVDPFVSVSRRRRRFTRRSWLTASHVVTAPLGEREGSVMDAALAASGEARRVALTVPSFTQAVLVAARTELVATVPRAVARAVAPRLPMVRPPVPFPAPALALIWHPRNTNDPRSRFARDVLVRAARFS